MTDATLQRITALEQRVQLVESRQIDLGSRVIIVEVETAGTKASVKTLRESIDQESLATRKAVMSELEAMREDLGKTLKAMDARMEAAQHERQNQTSQVKQLGESNERFVKASYLLFSIWFITTISAIILGYTPQAVKDIVAKIYLGFPTEVLGWDFLEKVAILVVTWILVKKLFKFISPYVIKPLYNWIMFKRRDDDGPF